MSDEQIFEAVGFLNEVKDVKEIKTAQLEEMTDISASNLCNILLYKKRCSFEVICRIAAALGYKTLYHKDGGISFIEED